jgi:hypothetical protein
MSADPRAGAERVAPPRSPAAWRGAWPLLAFAGFAALDLIVFRGALHGPFISDDEGYIAANTYLRQLSMENLAAFFDPSSPAQIHAVGNYAPVHLLLHAFEWQMFADRVFGYHVVNVLVHALASVLLAALLLRSGAPPLAAGLGALLFNLHPANVEAVAWISQLKSTAALAFALAALLALPRAPLVSALAFALGLLTKASAGFALPMAAALWFARRASPRAWAWLGVWVAIFAAYSAVELSEFEARGRVEEPAYADPWVHARSVAAYGARYLAMAATSFGVSAYQEPEPVRSPFDPWWLLALPAAALLAARIAVTLARRQEEAAWWIGAAAAWAPVSQVFPFVHPMADRYLYFVLPGLIGGTVLALAPRLGRLRVPAPQAGEAGAQRAEGERRRAPARLVAAAALAVAAGFAVHSSARARLWQSDLQLALEAARKHPNGFHGRLLRARSAAQRGDAATAVAELRGMRRFYEFRALDLDPGLAPIRQTPDLDALRREWAGRWIERARERGTATRSELRIVAQAHRVRGETDAAIAALQLALETPGPDDAGTRRELEHALALAKQEAGGAAGR